MGYLGKRRYNTGAAGPSTTGNKKARRGYRRTFSRAKVSRGVRTYGKDKLPFPKVLQCQLSLHLQTSATSTTGSFTGLSNALRLNDLSDPTGAMGTEKPRWTNELGAIYAKYVVYAAKVEVIAANAEKIGDIGMTCYDSDAPSSMREIGERDNSMIRVIDAASSGGVTQHQMVQYYDFAKIVGIPRSQYVNEDDYLTSIGAAPGNIVYWNIWHQAYGAQTGSVSLKVRVTFYCRFKSWKDPADS